ncbi:hypothetical protein [uncultured Treponema sp.]|uniref:hypothetical protein n=1 Tax=uncultured Treponema sp. TaxID=162155 RepID=UPI0025888D83|nr:hypothetical protein [uncultured Treponema sp.]
MKEKDGKIGILFGAGAERCFKMPTGSDFAMEILFPEDNVKDSAKKMFSKVFCDKNMFKFFDGSDYKTVIKSTIEKRKTVLENFFTEKNIDISLFNDYYSKIEEFPTFEKNKAKTEPCRENFIKLVRLYTAFFMISKGIKERDSFNAAIGVESNSIKNLFDDVAIEDLHSFNYSRLISLNKETVSLIRTKLDSNVGGGNSSLIKVYEEVRSSVYDIFAKTLDYQLLMNEYYDYLFDKNESSSKRNKIASFLFVIQQYIKKQFDEKKALEKGKTYYADILDKNQNDFFIASTNYSKIPKLEIEYLNGSTDKYLNLDGFDVVAEDSVSKNKKCVPFIFPQTTLKPFVSVDAVLPFAKTFEKFNKCSKIAVIGFNFNDDDSLIKSMFHKLLMSGKKVIYFSYKYEEDEDIKKIENKLEEKLCFSNNTKNLSVRLIDDDRKDTETGKNWLDYLQTI